MNKRDRFKINYHLPAIRLKLYFLRNHMRITRKVFTDLAVWMVCFGLAIGVVFPFFIILLGVSSHIAITPKFFMACLGAGIAAGGINFWLARAVLGGRLRVLSTVGERMRNLADTMRSAPPVSMEEFFTWMDAESPCGVNGCHVEVDSTDEIGESAKTFNLLADTLRRTVTAERIVNAFAHMVSKHLELSSLSEQALLFWTRVFKAEAGLIAVIKEEVIEISASRHIRNLEAVKGSSHLAECLKTGKIIESPIPENVSVDHVVGEHLARHVYITPVYYKNTPLGAVLLATAEPLTEEDYRRMEMIRTSFAMALNNTLTHCRLRLLASLDPLTGIYNRGFGLNRLREEFKRSLRSGAPLGVLMFDIDHFKSINDTFGHLVGDRVIKRITGTVRTILREGDIMIRYGGEEFLLVLPAAAGSDLLKIGERIRRGIETLIISEADISINITISLGGVSWPEMDVQSEEELVRHADEALYKAKESGRNKVEMYSVFPNAHYPKAKRFNEVKKHRADGKR
jgi:two-component system, cell cycle response regulator